MFIVYPSNIDYLIDDVRLHIGDTEKKQFSDSLVRASLLGGIKMLQRKWKNRYLVFVQSMIVDDPPSNIVVPSGFVYGKVPEGYALIPSGLTESDVFRNPYHIFIDPGTSVISQEDEYIVILAAAITLRKSYLTGNAEHFQSWSDGEFSFSNLSTSKTLGGILESDIAELNSIFKHRLAPPLRSDFMQKD